MKNDRVKTFCINILNDCQKKKKSWKKYVKI